MGSINRTAKYALNVSICFVAAFVLWFHFAHETDTKLQQNVPEARATKKKTILMWNHVTDSVEIASFGVDDPEAFARHGCPVDACQLTSRKANQQDFHLYDAIVFNIPELRATRDYPLPSFADGSRKFKQRMVFFSQEPPVHTWNDPAIHPSNLTRFFNWTMTYRLDSDIRLAYGSFYKKKATQLLPNRQRVGLKKPRSIAWMVTHCPTDGRRESYVIRLKKYIDIDVYGGCGELACNRTWDFSSPDCYAMLEANYKFYLAFENSLCHDYVTEKLYQVLERRLIPVVYGLANYTRLAPPGSYIDARLFEPKALADYLRYLDANDEAYNEYFKWKSEYAIRAGVKQMSVRGFCDLCKLLHEDRTNKIYDDLAKHWDPDVACWRNINKGLSRTLSSAKKLVKKLLATN